MKFIVVKFVQESSDPDTSDDVYYEVASSKWLLFEKETNTYQCYWPPESFTEHEIVKMIKNQTPPPNDNSWTVLPCEVKSSYADYLTAHLGAKNRLNDSSYETEKELGRGRRRRVQKVISSSENEPPPKKQIITPPKNIALPSKGKGFSRFNAQPKVKSVVKVCEVNTSNRQDQNKAMNIVRKNRGSDASSTTELRAKLLERKKQMEQKVSFPVKSISSNWKTKRDSHSPGQENALQHSQSFVQEGETARQSLSSGHKDEQNNFLSDDFAQNVKISGKDSDVETQWNGSFATMQIPTKKTKKKLSFSPVKEVSGQVESLHKPYFSDFEKDVLKLLKELNGKIETVSSNVAKLNMHILPNEKVFSRPKDMPTLPLKTLKEVSQMETFLQDVDNLSCTSIYLSSYVSKNPLSERTSVMKLMAQIFTNVVGSEFSFSGQAGKHKFKDLLLWTALKGAVSLKIADTDFSASKKGVQVWLKDAKWRDQEGSTSSQQPSPSQKKSTRRERGLRQKFSSTSEESTSSTSHTLHIT